MQGGRRATGANPDRDQSSKGAMVRKTIALLVTTIVGAVALITAISGFAGATSSAKRGQVLGVRIVATDSFFVDNDPSGNSGGDLFGSTGDLRRRGQKVGNYSSACTASSAAGGQCQVTFVLGGGGRLQLAGTFYLQRTQNRISIVGGTGKFRRARGDAILRVVGGQGAIQHARLTILR